MKGSIEIFQVPSACLEGNVLSDPSKRATPVYLPPGYAENTKERYPVVYFLHGFTGSGLSWLNSSPFTKNVPERVDALVASGAIPPCIGIFVDGWTSLGGSQWINSEGIGRYREYVAKDLVKWADKNLRTVPKAAARALVGKSSGGYGAWVISRYHHDVFSHVGVHSGDAAFEYCYLHELPQAAGPLLKAGGVEAWFHDFRLRAAATKMRGDDHVVINMIAMSAAYSPKRGEPLNLELPVELVTGRLKIEVWNRWLVHDPVRFIPKHLDLYRKLKSIFIDCGTRDEFNLRWGARIIAEELKAGGVDFLHEEFEDGHMGVNYRFERSLSYLVPRMDVKA
ncbi:MAG: alpha/beta hydrolase [Myxococcaceae bacterium]|nr:alpha/beta hydrolase [Myxococcaceae bacterium]